MSRSEKAIVDGDKVRRAMRAVAATPADIAAVAGFSTSTVSRAVNGRPISIAAIARLARALKLRPADLLEAEPSVAERAEAATA